MGLSWCADGSAADWISRSGVPWNQLVGFGPAGFADAARLRFIPDPARPGQTDLEVEIPDDHPSDLAQSRRALHVLAAFTATPEDCWFCLWDGYGDVTFPTAPPPAMIDVPNRRYALLRGALDDVDEWERFLGGHRFPPAFAWPADRSWCFARDVDPHWAGISAGRAAIDALRRDPALDVVTAQPAVEQPAYY